MYFPTHVGQGVFLSILTLLHASLAPFIAVSNLFLKTLLSDSSLLIRSHEFSYFLYLCICHQDLLLKLSLPQLLLQTNDFWSMLNVGFFSFRADNHTFLPHFGDPFQAFPLIEVIPYFGLKLPQRFVDIFADAFLDLVLTQCFPYLAISIRAVG